MNWQQLAYRVRIGGLPWIVRTALGLKGRLLKGGRNTPLAYDLGSRSDGIPKILYIHSGWAIETVGKLWFGNLKCAKVTFVGTGDPLLTPEYLSTFDLVWYGYSHLFWQYPTDLAKVVIAVHDPVELFAEKPDWKDQGSIHPDAVAHLNSVKAVVVISEEMQNLMERSGVSAYRIPTCSQVPLRDASELTRVPAALLAVGRIYRRKNFERFLKLAKSARSRFGVPSRLKHDQFPLSEESYLALLDRYPIYICTSFQEGGPLPVMDAMRRGAVAVSTKVGQIPEIIEHGVNGFICQTDEELLNAIEVLAKDPDKLLEMRKRALASIESVRSEDSVAGTAERTVQSILGPRIERPS